MANTPPNAAFQYGNVQGKLSAKIIPVTTALKSKIETGLFVILLYMYSEATHVITVKIINNAE